MILVDKNKSCLPKVPVFKINPRSWHFWRDSFLYFWVFSLIGHLIEYPWFAVLDLVGAGHPPMPPFFIIAAPYGLGILGILWFVVPMMKKFKLGLIPTYLWSVFVTTAIEFVAAVVLIVVHGHNPYWDYSSQPANLFGCVLLSNSLMFGLLVVAFLYYIFPRTDRLLKKIKDKPLNVAAICLMVAYVVVQVYNFISFINY